MAALSPISRTSTVLLSIATLMGAAMAAPPPPALTPPALDQPVDGYDMRGPYQIWRYWVERQKGPVTEALLERSDEIEGLKPLGLLLRFKKHDDFGHFLTGEIQGYCRTSADGYTPVPGSCRYLLRRAYVPLAAEDYGDSNPVSEWTRTNFDAKALSRHFRSIGLSPDTDWWLADWNRMFSAAPSPRDVLAENAVMVRLDSIECPQMGQAIEALEGKPLVTRIDLATVGTDQELVAPTPHAVMSDYTVYLRADGDMLKLAGSGGPVAQIVNPILDAADACEQARNGGG
jgi:hypothetical protein